MDLSQINSTPPRAVTTSGRWITNPEPSSPAPSPTGSVGELRLAASLLDAATRMHDSHDPRAVVGDIADEALRLLTADGVLVLVHDQKGSTPLLHRLSTGAEADPTVTVQLCRELATDRHLEPGRVTELDRRRLQRPEPTGGADRSQPSRWRSVLVADLDSARSSRSAQLVWYAATAEAFTGRAELAALFARHAGLALRNVSERHHLLRAVESRTTTGQATGILMDRYHLTAERAFEVLRGFSQDRNVKLRDVAAAVVHTGELPS